MLPSSPIPHTTLLVSRLCLGGNVFGWTADDAESARVLDRFVADGGNFIDTADVYSAWVPGHSGGESEATIGRWLKGRADRDSLVISTKVAKKDDCRGLGATTIARAADDSLRRLRTDYIDVYWAHSDDPTTPMEETLDAFGTLIDAGKVRAIGASNFSAPRLEAAIAISEREGLPRYALVQPLYNLVEREYEADLAPAVRSHGLCAVPYRGLGNGFLTGKYRPGAELPAGPRAATAADYLASGAGRVLEILEEVAGAHETSIAATALAWLAAQPTVLSPIASARCVDQLEDLLAFGDLELTSTGGRLTTQHRLARSRPPAPDRVTAGGSDNRVARFPREDRASAAGFVPGSV
jgi:aryl-alcohol dehydrogenase-like predicted oxidoreductase